MTPEPFGFANWISGEPDDQGFADRAWFGPSLGPNGAEWADGIDATAAHGFVVEFEAPGAPSILVPPSGLAGALGGRVGFSVLADGAPELSFRWHRDGVPLVDDARRTGAFGSRLVITDLQPNDAGRYSVTVTNPVGRVTSDDARLTVWAGTAPTDSHTRFHLSFDETVQGSAGELPTLVSGVDFVPGMIGAGAWMSETNHLVYDSAGKIAAAAGTLEFWIRPRWAGNDQVNHTVLCWGEANNMVFAKDGANHLRSIYNGGGVVAPEIGIVHWVGNWTADTWRHVAFTWRNIDSPKSVVCRLYLDGALVQSVTHSTVVHPPLPNARPDLLRLGGEFAWGEGNLQAVLDELSLSDVERTPDEIAASYRRVAQVRMPRVVGRHVFYNQSAFDGNDPAANAADDDAIAPDKTALMPGARATFSHYTSYPRGLNGIMIDIAGLPGDPTTADFTFRAGNSATPESWPAGPTPAGLTIRRGAGIAGSDRVTLVWGTDAVKKRWLQVTILPTSATGLEQPDVFYFGNAIGETGNAPSNARVTGVDALRVLCNLRTGVPAGNPCDIDRDGKVGAADRMLVLDNLAVLDPLPLLDLTGAAILQARPRAPGGTGPRLAQVQRVESGLRVRWIPEGSPMTIWTSTEVSGGEWEVYDTLDAVGRAGDTLEVVLPVDPEGPPRFYRLESLPDR